MLPLPKAKSNKPKSPKVAGRKRGRQRVDHGLKIDKVIEVIHRERGILVEIALELGVSRQIVREFAAMNAPVSAALKEAREAMGDVAERKLYELIEAGDVRCITYYLSTVHKNRGYGIRKDESVDPFAETKMHVQTINVLAIPPGQYLTSAEAAVLAKASLPPPIEHTEETAMSNGRNGNGNDDNGDHEEDYEDEPDRESGDDEPAPAPVKEPEEQGSVAAEEETEASLACLM